MDGRGAWRDNVFVERLWRSVKYERVYLKAYDSVSAARVDIADYLGWYNTTGRIRVWGATPDEAYLAPLPNWPRLRKMKSLVRPELPTAALRSSQATHAAVDNSAPSATRPEPTYKSGKVVQINGATSRDRSIKYDRPLLPVGAKFGQLGRRIEVPAVSGRIHLIEVLPRHFQELLELPVYICINLVRCVIALDYI